MNLFNTISDTLYSYYLISNYDFKTDFTHENIKEEFRF